MLNQKLEQSIKAENQISLNHERIFLFSHNRKKVTFQISLLINEESFFK